MNMNVRTCNSTYTKEFILCCVADDTPFKNNGFMQNMIKLANIISSPLRKNGVKNSCFRNKLPNVRSIPTVGMSFK